jgi:hypothetical protein
MEPINYLQQVADPFAQALQGFKIGAGLADLEAQRALAVRQQQQQQLAVQEQARFFTNPKPTMRDAARYASLLSPEQSKAFLPYMEGISKQEQQGLLKSTGQILSALQSNPQAGIKLLEERALAARNSGDEDDARLFEQMAEAAADPQRGPATAFKSLTVSVAGIPGSKEFLENIDKTLSTARLEAQALAELRQKRAAADKAEAEARVKMETAPDDIAKAKATREFEQAKAAKEQIEAQFASPLAQAELNKRIAETLAPSVREAIDFKNLSPADQAVFQNLQILKKPPAAVTNVNVSNVDKTAAGELGKLVPDLYTQMNAASDLTGELARYRTALGTAITGPFADRRLQVAQVANAFGLIGDKGINATRELIQGNAEMSLKARSLIAGQGQGPITEGEQALLVKARAGDINFTKGELNTLFNIFDRAAKAQYDQSRKLLQSATTQSPTAQIFLDAAKPFGAQTAPPVQPAASPQTAPVAQPAQTAPAMPAGFRVIQRGQ